MGKCIAITYSRVCVGRAGLCKFCLYNSWNHRLRCSSDNSGDWGIGLLCVAQYGMGSNLAVHFDFFSSQTVSKSWQFVSTSLYKSESIYHISPLLCACAYISTGRKPALNGEVCLTKNSYIKNAWAFMVSFKGHGQLIDRTIVHVAAFHPDWNCVHCWKNLRIDSS